MTGESECFFEAVAMWQSKIQVTCMNEWGLVSLLERAVTRVPCRFDLRGIMRLDSMDHGFLSPSLMFQEADFMVINKFA